MAAAALRSKRADPAGESSPPADGPGAACPARGPIGVVDRPRSASKGARGSTQPGLRSSRYSHTGKRRGSVTSITSVEAAEGVKMTLGQ